MVYQLDKDSVGYYPRKSRRNSKAKKQIVMTANVTSIIPHLKLRTIVHGKLANAMVDLGSHANLIDLIQVREYKVPQRPKEHPYQVLGLDGKGLGIGAIIVEIEPIWISIGTY